MKIFFSPYTHWTSGRYEYSLLNDCHLVSTLLTILMRTQKKASRCLFACMCVFVIVVSESICCCNFGSSTGYKYTDCISHRTEFATSKNAAVTGRKSVFKNGSTLLFHRIFVLNKATTGIIPGKQVHVSTFLMHKKVTSAICKSILSAPLAQVFLLHLLYPFILVVVIQTKTAGFKELITFTALYYALNLISL